LRSRRDRVKDILVAVKKNTRYETQPPFIRWPCFTKSKSKTPGRAQPATETLLRIRSPHGSKVVSAQTMRKLAPDGKGTIDISALTRRQTLAFQVFQD
jgi:hypothetical protein